MLKPDDVNWFRPLWIRVGLTALLTIWCAWEWFWNKDAVWGMLVGAALAYAVVNLFYAFPKDDLAPPSENPPD